MQLAIDDLLRARGRHAVGAPPTWAELGLLVLCGGLLYGLVMGSWGLRPMQMLYSGLKVPMLTGVTTLICLPSFYVFCTVLGLRADSGPALRAVLGSQAVFAVTLASLSPFTALYYLSIQRYQATTSFNGLLFLAAIAAAQFNLNRHYRPLERRNPRHRIAKRGWLLLYIFVAIQMAWILRPFIGDPRMPTAFFREDAFSNAYVGVYRSAMALF